MMDTESSRRQFGSSEDCGAHSLNVKEGKKDGGAGKLWASQKSRSFSQFSSFNLQKVLPVIVL